MASNSREQISPPKEVLTKWLARLYRRRLTTTTGGNLSLLDDDDTLYITPSGGDKALVPMEKIAYRTSSGTNWEGPVAPSMEWPLHVAAYQARPEARAVLHAHSQSLVAFSIANGNDDDKKNNYDGDDKRIPNTACLLETWQSCGKVALANYHLPGTQELAEACSDAFSSGADCVILKNHGVVVVGKSLHQAYDRFISLEYLAQSIILAESSLHLPVKRLPLKILQFANCHDYISPNNPFPAPIPAKYENRLITGREKTLRKEICTLVHRAYDQNLITSSSGSISLREDDASLLSFLITPTSVDRGALEPSDVCFVWSRLSTNGNKRLKGLFHAPIHHPQSPDAVTPSRAARLHAKIYELHPEVNCVMVVQPPNATAFCITGRRFDAGGIPESYIVLEDIETLGLEEAIKNDGKLLAETLDPNNGKNTLIVQGYGIVTVGTGLLKTFVQLEVMESMCGVMLKGLSRGKVELLSKQEKHELHDRFHSHATVE